MYRAVKDRVIVSRDLTEKETSFGFKMLDTEGDDHNMATHLTLTVESVPEKYQDELQPGDRVRIPRHKITEIDETVEKKYGSVAFIDIIAIING